MITLTLIIVVIMLLLWLGFESMGVPFSDADLRAVIFRQPCGEVSETFGEGGKTGFIILGSVVTVSNANASVNPGLVNVETAAVIQDDFEHGVPPAKYLQGQQGLAVRKIESISKR